MISRVRGRTARSGEAGGAYRQLLRWAALPVTDRRWAAPLSAVALGFGLFASVAIGPGAAGTFATGAAQIIEIPGFGGGTDYSGEEEEGPSPSAPGSGGAAASGGGGASTASASALPSLTPAPSGSEFSEPIPSSPSAPPSSPEKAEPNLTLDEAVAVSEPDAPTDSQCANMATILWQIYADEPTALPFPDSIALQAWLCDATPAPALPPSP